MRWETGAYDGPHHLSMPVRLTSMVPETNTPSTSPEWFADVVGTLRPELHRFCARMTGSVADGEDVLQEVLAKAHASLPELRDPSVARSWLFRMAHNQAIDQLRSNQRRARETLDDGETATSPAPEEQLAREEAVRAAISLFVELPPLQRSCVILKDVLEHSLREIAELLELSVPAVQAALHRGRARLRELRALSPQRSARILSPVVGRYAELFNARDWAGVRALLADDLRLEVVSRFERTGRDSGSSYFTNYAGLTGWRVAPGWLDGREVLAFFNAADDERAAYFIELRVDHEKVLSIRDFRHVPYVAREARIDYAHHPPGADRLKG
jgi:RNA polymerase sigma factor (sigma-70 family)